MLKNAGSAPASESDPLPNWCRALAVGPCVPCGRFWSLFSSAHHRFPFIATSALPPSRICLNNSQSTQSGIAFFTPTSNHSLPRQRDHQTNWQCQLTTISEDSVIDTSYALTESNYLLGGLVNPAGRDVVHCLGTIQSSGRIYVNLKNRRPK
ncbi:hypothetical protein PM082_022485 [Marasmius tenuissimus]|nr:hypothetical protein PM082_022485 [Marasmius tenuissimus]